MSGVYIWQRMILFLGVGTFIYIIRPGSRVHRISMNGLERIHKAVCVFTVIVTCSMAFWTMTISDWWSDEGPDYQFQYEAMTDAVLNGHLYLDLEVSPELAAMDNPYDSGRRAEENVPFYWDHAFFYSLQTVWDCVIFLSGNADFCDFYYLWDICGLS